MKILAITANIDPAKLGGAERHFVEVAKRLESRGVTVVAPQIKFPRVPNLSGFFYILFAVPALLGSIIKNRQDILWATLDFPQAQVGAIVKLLTGLPLYITSQNPVLCEEEFVGRFGKLGTFFVAAALRLADTVAAVSSYSATQAKRLGAKNVVIIPNGVNLEVKNQKSKIKSSSQKLKIITVSWLVPRNGIDVLIKACSLLSTDFELTVAGDGPERKKLERLAKGLPIKFLGNVPSNKITQLLRKNNLFVRPSRAEGFGAAFIEAMAVGLPAIGTPVGGIVDFLLDKQTGFLVRPENPAVLAQTIEYISKNPKIAAKIAAAGQKLVLEKYPWDKIADSVYQEFQKLCS